MERRLFSNGIDWPAEAQCAFNAKCCDMHIAQDADIESRDVSLAPIN